MFDSKVFLTSIRKSAYTSAAAVLAIGAMMCADARAQDQLRDAVYGGEKSAAKTESKTFSARRKTTPAPVRKTSRTTVKNTAKVFSADNFVTVTFTAKEPKVEIWLNDKRIGVTDQKSQFSTKVAPGEYRLVGKSKSRVVYPMKTISISAQQNSFNLFNEDTIIDIPAPDKSIAVKPEEKPELQAANELSGRIKEILENYTDPAKTDQVTLADWEMVFQAAQLGQLQGYTAVQIEAQRWFASGQIELAKKEYTNAFTAFNKSAEFMPTSALPHYGLGNTYLANGQYADAIKAYQRALQFDPKMGMAYKKLGDALRLSEKDKEATAAYKNAVQYGYQTPETRYGLAALLMKGKQTTEGIQALEEVAKDMPTAEVYVSIGEGYEKLKRDVSAIEYYQKAIDTDPNLALAHFRLASVYFEQREYNKAKTLFEKAVELDPEGKTMNRGEAQKKLREATSKSK